MFICPASPSSILNLLVTSSIRLSIHPTHVVSSHCNLFNHNPHVPDAAFTVLYVFNLLMTGFMFLLYICEQGQLQTLQLIIYN